MIFFLIIIKIAQFIPLGIIQILFYLMIFKAGMWVGCQFPAAVSILQDSYSSGYAASLVWGADLLGAMIGGLVSSLIIIPVLGITNTILAGFTLGFITCLLLAISLQRPQQ
jgi:predicted membrane-bound spermidine synthase